MTMACRYRAAWVFPVDQPPLANGVVAIEGSRIVAVGRADRLGVDVDLGDAALLPGFVNAHVHLDLTGLRGKLPPPQVDDPTPWLEEVIAHRRGATAEETEAAVRVGIEECLASGTTAVGDIDGSGLSAGVLQRSSLRGVSYRELIGLTEPSAARARETAERWQEGFGSVFSAGARRRAGLSPHSPYSARRELLAWAAGRGTPIAMHLGEFKGEEELLERRAGPFRAFLERLGVWEDTGLLNSWSEALAVLSSDLLAGKGRGNGHSLALAHGNHLPPPLFPSLRGASIVFCPRTHAYFGHPPHPFREMLAAGVNVALGTDGLSSNPDLSLFQEMRFLWGKFGGEMKGDTLLAMGTQNGAGALGLLREIGTLTPGKQADVIAIALDAAPAEDPFRRLFASSGLVRLAFVDGEAAVREGERLPKA